MFRTRHRAFMQGRISFGSIIAISVLLLSAPGSTQSAVTKDRSAADRRVWERDERVIVYKSDRRSRYPSITKTADGRLLVLFTHQSQAQEKAGRGELMMVKRSADGKWWLDRQLVYASTDGEPRAYGTMTTLASGKIIAPFAQVNDQAATSRVRIASSEDDGQTFQIGPPIAIEALRWAVPSGRPFEFDGAVVMPVFGAMSNADLGQTRHTCGLLRSRDGGKTWSDWSVIASGSKGELSFEYCSVLPLNDGTILAVLTGRRLERSIDAPQVLMRCYSEDGGRTWSAPDQLGVGSWPALVAVDEQTVVCAYTVWSGWGDMRLLASDDGFRSFYQDQVFVEHGWLTIPGDYPKIPLPDTDLKLESGRPFWAYHPVPLPPIVPHMKGDWRVGHYGFPAVLPLSRDKLVVVLGNRQRGTIYTDPPSEVTVPIELERIEAITFDRLPSPEDPVPLAPKIQTTVRWEISESWTPKRWKRVVKKRSGFRLRSGRRVKWTGGALTDHHINWIVGKAKGYWIHAYERHFEGPPGHWEYSDNNSKTWIDAEMVDPSPLANRALQSGQMYELDDGTIVAPFYGYVNDRDMLNHHYGCYLSRSHDGGRTWGDWSAFGYDSENLRSSYCEATLLPIADDYWVAFMRTEMAGKVPWMGAMMTRAVSTDRGYTWSKPHVTVTGSQPAMVTLPDGGLVMAIRTHGRQAPGVYFSYDHGATWDYVLAGPYNISDAGMLNDDRFWVYSGNEVVIYQRRR